MPRNTGSSKELPIQLDLSYYEDIAKAGSLYEKPLKPTRLGKELLEAAVDLVLDSTRRPVLPRVFVDLRQKLHNFPADPYSSDASLVPEGRVMEVPPEVLRAQLGEANARRELAETKLKLVQAETELNELKQAIEAARAKQG